MIAFLQKRDAAAATSPIVVYCVIEGSVGSKVYGARKATNGLRPNGPLNTSSLLAVPSKIVIADPLQFS